MRRKRWPSRGRPDEVTSDLEELVVVLQASIEVANAERWALEFGEQPVPVDLPPELRRSAYEVTVVDAFHRLARSYFRARGYRAVWERPFHTGARGRPLAVDISLFHTGSQSETRLELGLYTKSKLKSDATKLAELGSPMEGYETIINLLALWEITEDRLTEASLNKWMNKFKDDAQDISPIAEVWQVRPLMASAIDLFVAPPRLYRYATVGLFSLAMDDGP